MAGLVEMQKSLLHTNAGNVAKALPEKFWNGLASRSSKGRVVWHGSRAPHSQVQRKGLKVRAPWGRMEAIEAQRSSNPFSLTRRRAVFATTDPKEAMRYAAPGSRVYAVDPDVVHVQGKFSEKSGIEHVLGKVPKNAILHSQVVNPTTVKRY